MNSMGLKQKALVAILAVVMLYGFAVVLWFTTCESSWKKSRKQYETAKSNYLKEEKMIGEKAKWTADYETEKKAMPMFAGDVATDTKWLSVVDSLAETNHIWISQRENGKEVQAGDVYELEVSVRNWEGALESLTHFLYGLEDTDWGMFDVKAISIKPIGSKPGYLKGSLTVSCAYMREERK